MTNQGCFYVRSIITLDHHFVVGAVPYPRLGLAAVRVNLKALLSLTQQGFSEGISTAWRVGGSRPRGGSSAGVALAKPLPGAKYAGFSSGSHTVGLSLAEVEYSNVLIALRLNGKTLPHEHGGPCRLIATGKECHFSVKWIDRIDLRSSPSLT